HSGIYQSLQMLKEQHWNLSSSNEHASFHVLFHRMSSQVGASDKTYTSISGCDLGVNASIREWCHSLSPSEELRGGYQCLHPADNVERNASPVILRRLEQHRDAHTACACVVQRPHDGRDVVSHEASDEQGLFGRANDL